MEKTETLHIATDAFHCDFKHQLCLGHLGNDLLNAADVHSTNRKFGMSYLNTFNKTWVLSRLAIELEDMPKEHDHITITTWVENAMKYFTKRNWEILSEDGTKVYGYAKSIWAMIDTVTREPQDIFTVNDGTIVDYVYPEKVCPIKDVSRVKTPEMTDFTEFKVTYSDLDVNGHLNSVRYLDHVMDTFPLEYLREHELKRIEVAYVAEGHWNEVIRIYHLQEDEQNHYFRIARNVEGEGEVELSRLKIEFRKH
ncbi:MAG: thioesterase [Prevotellaceae bacterium]|nr:thioesterase [Prevotellaceae bacterium]